MPGNTSGPPPGLVKLVSALALLDTDFPYRPDETATGSGVQPGTKPAKPFELRGRRWNQETLTERCSALADELRKKVDERRHAAPPLAADQTTEPQGVLAAEQEEANGLLLANDPTTRGKGVVALLRALPGDAPSGSLHEALGSALNEAIRISHNPEGSAVLPNAGAIYLYDSQFNELVMVASKGFPLALEAGEDTWSWTEAKDLLELGYHLAVVASACVRRPAMQAGSSALDIASPNVRISVAKLETSAEDEGLWNAFEREKPSSEARRGVICHLKQDLGKGVPNEKVKLDAETAVIHGNLSTLLGWGRVAWNLYLNVCRLRHCSESTHDRLLEGEMWRADWVKDEWKGAVDTEWEPGSEGPKLDCNTALLGVANYQPGKGITGQLFDKEQGPTLERLKFTDHRETYRSKLVGRVAWPPGEDPNDPMRYFREELTSFLIDDHLLRRTVGFERRDEMASGRQVQAGTYEGLQFPDSSFIGPFLGCVLRFGGEHFGVMKVERHHFAKKPHEVDKAKLPDAAQGLPKSLQARYHPQPNPQGSLPFFGDAEVIDFVLFCYAFSGVLYLLKHHYGLDLMEAFRRSCPKSKKEGER